jgi:hypothetical protein
MLLVFNCAPMLWSHLVKLEIHCISQCVLLDFPCMSCLFLSISGVPLAAIKMIISLKGDMKKLHRLFCWGIVQNITLPLSNGKSMNFQITELAKDREDVAYQPPNSFHSLFTFIWVCKN